MHLIIRWMIGLSISLIAGHFVSRKFRDLRNQHINKVTNDSEDKNRQERDQLPSKRLPMITGVIERTFFTFIVAFDVSGGAIAMMAWLAAKMAVNWNRVSVSDSATRGFSMTALQAGMVSLFFALIGGLICKS